MLDSQGPNAAAPTDTRELTMSAKGHVSVPQAVFDMASVLHTLDLSKNQLTELPCSFANLVHLVTLNLAGNQLACLPHEVGALAHLAHLDVSKNLLSDLPAALARCHNLREVRLGANTMTRVPAALLGLPRLAKLHLGANAIEALPADMHRMQGLEVLYLGQNRLEHLPASLGRLQHLSVLYLGDNRLVDVPPQICALPRLQVLNLHNNCLRMLPPQMLSLDSLQELTLRGNPLVSEFVHDMPAGPLSLKEVCGRAMWEQAVPFTPADLPSELQVYLRGARRCTNPRCAGVYFAAPVTGVDFVDFCGKYRIPLMKFLCRAHTPHGSSDDTDGDASSGADDSGAAETQRRRLARVLLTGYAEHNTDPLA